MKVNQLVVRPSSKPNGEFSIFWAYEINKAKEIFSGTEDECYRQKKKITNLSDMVWSRIIKDFTEEKFNALNTDENTILQINIGALCFEFTTRDFRDGAGLEVNCECFILGKEGYGVTSEYTNEKAGYPYDNEFCLNYYISENVPFEKRKEFIQQEILEAIVLYGFENYAFEEDLTWDSIKLEQKGGEK